MDEQKLIEELEKHFSHWDIMNKKTFEEIKEGIN